MERSNYKTPTGGGYAVWAFLDSNGNDSFWLFPFTIFNSRNSTQYRTKWIEENPEANQKHKAQVEIEREKMRQLLEKHLKNNINLVLQLKNRVAWAYKTSIEVSKEGHSISDAVMNVLSRMSQKVRFVGTVSDNVCVSAKYAGYTNSHSERESVSFGIFSYTSRRDSSSETYYAHETKNCSTTIFTEEAEQNQAEGQLVNMGQIEEALNFYQRHAVLAREIYAQKTKEETLFWNSPYK